MYIREGKSISTFNSNQVFFHQNFWKIWEMMFHTKGIFFCFCWKIRVIKVFSSKLSKKFVKSVSFSSKPSKNSWNQFFSSKLSLFTLWNESTQNSKIHFDVKTKKKKINEGLFLQRNLKISWNQFFLSYLSPIF